MIVIRLVGDKVTMGTDLSHPLTLPRGFYFNGILINFVFT